MFLLMLLLIAYPASAQLPSNVVLDSVYSGQNSIHSIAFKPTTDIELEKGDTREAAELFQQSRVLFDAIGDDKGEAVQATILGNAYVKVENFHAAEGAYRQAVQLFEKVSDLKAVADVRVSLGGVYASNQAPYDALLQWRQALELYRELQIDDKVEFVEELLRTSGRM